MTILRGSGRLRHRFWGEYSAVLAIAFPDEATARLAVSRLNTDSLQWEQIDRGVRIVVDSDQLETVKAHLSTFGADTRAIDSLRFSVDHGEPWTVEIPVPDAQDPAQLLLEYAKKVYSAV